ncbi:MAG: thiamine pyrophosphate-dependent enzyme, partial [Pseudomonadota bacterium]
MIRVDLDARVLADRYRAELCVLSDIGAFCDAVLPKISKRPPAWSAEELAVARHRFRAQVDAELPGILAWTDALMEAVPEDTFFVSDMTQFAYKAKELCVLRAPRRWIHPYGFGTLGYALPAAIGAKIGRGDGPVLAIAGDYGFQYTSQEIAVAVEHRLSLPILLWDNNGLGEIAEAMVRAQVPPRAVTALNPNFEALAAAYGALSETLEQPEALAGALDRAFAHPGPTLLRLKAGTP